MPLRVEQLWKPRSVETAEDRLGEIRLGGGAFLGTAEDRRPQPVRVEAGDADLFEADRRERDSPADEDVPGI